MSKTGSLNTPTSVYFPSVHWYIIAMVAVQYESRPEMCVGWTVFEVAGNLTVNDQYILHSICM